MVAQFPVDVVVDPQKARRPLSTVEAGFTRLDRRLQSVQRTLERAFSQGARAAEPLKRQAGDVQRRVDGATRSARNLGRQLRRDSRGRFLSNAAKDAENLGDEAEKAGDKVKELRRLLTRAFAGIGIALVLKEFVRLSDEFARVQNRLRVVTDGTQNLRDVTGDLFGVASRTRSEFAATAELYSRLAVSAGELGRTESELLQFTESLNQAITLSGASAEEARAGIIQLSQGIASGALRGDELRSVLEQLPAVADVIARSLGVTRGELRELGAQGAITADVVLDAFAKARGELQDRFGRTVPTVAQSMTGLGNASLRLAGAIDQSTGATATLSKGIQFLNERLEAAAMFFEDITNATENRNIDATLSEYGQLGQQIQSLTRLQERLRRVFDEGGQTNQVVAREIERLGRGIADLRSQQDRLTESTKKNADEAVKQSEAFKLINAQLEERQRLAGFDQREAAIQQEITKATQALAKAGVELSEAQRQELEARIRSTIAKEREREVINSLRGPDQERIERLRVLREALDRGAISQREFNDAVAEATNAPQPLGPPAPPAVQGPELPGGRFEVPTNFVGPTRPGDLVSPETEALSRQLRVQAEILESIQGPQQAYREEIAAINDLIAEGRGPTEELNQRLLQLRIGALESSTSFAAGFERAFLKIQQQANDTASVVEGVVGVLVDTTVDALTELVQTGEADWKAFGLAAIQEIQRIIIEMLVLKAIQAALSLVPGGQAATAAPGAVAGVGALAGGLPGLQEGGTAQAGRSFIVGEREPEIFTPRTTGTVTPLSALPQQQPQPIQVVIQNMVDSRQIVRDGLEGGSNDDVIVNRIGANKNSVRGTIAG